MTRIFATLSGMAEKDPYKVAVGDRIKAAMTESGIPSSAALAKLMGCDEPRVRNWVNGTSVPPVPEGAQLRRLFGVTLDWLYLGDWSGLIEGKRIRLTAILNGGSPPVWAAAQAEEPATEPASRPRASVRASGRKRTFHPS